MAGEEGGDIDDIKYLIDIHRIIQITLLRDGIKISRPLIIVSIINRQIHIKITFIIYIYIYRIRYFQNKSLLPAWMPMLVSHEHGLW